jgi:hypothetical protein
MPEAGQAAERDEQQQAQVIKALMQGICAVRYRKADNTPCPIAQVGTTALSFRSFPLDLVFCFVSCRSCDA